MCRETYADLDCSEVTITNISVIVSGMFVQHMFDLGTADNSGGSVVTLSRSSDPAV